MKIKIKENHKSIKERIEFELPDFSVLTGKNGSGKTHLLEALANKDITEVSVNGILVKNARYIPFNGLNPSINENGDPDTILKNIKDLWGEFVQVRNQEINQRGGGAKTNDSVLNRIRDVNKRKHCERILEKSGKEFNQLTEEDFHQHHDVSFLGGNNFFTAQFALIFKNYHIRLLENQENLFYNSQNLETTGRVLTDQEFLEQNGGPPWEFVNTILEEAGIPYEVNNPLGTRKDSTFKFILKDRSQGFEISSAHLSTGEKVLMSLALAIYNTGSEQEKPDLLLIDEPDAGLHPSMSRKMVNVLRNNIVNVSNIPSIITTHSPTTVVAAEGISIYQLDRGNNKPRKISTQEAVDLLSGDVPFLKISTESRRQVFVESKYDVKFFELITNIYSRIQTFPSEPIYIPARTSLGSNCTDVINIVESLYGSGNDQIYGIIDWDLTNVSKDRVLVLGNGNRYAIENYLLDPLLMGLLMIRENEISINNFGLQSVTTYSQLGNLSEMDAQKIINKILSDLLLKTENEETYQTFNGWELSITTEFNKYQGHDLESHYKSTFPFLNVYQREDALKKDIIEKVINDYPEFAPLALSETIMKVV